MARMGDTVTERQRDGIADGYMESAWAMEKRKCQIMKKDVRVC
jgi:hypothetical protein